MLRKKLLPSSSTSVQAAPDQLLLAPKVPQPLLHTRELAEYMPVFRSFHAAGTTSATPTETDEFARRVEAVSWYHTIAMPGGIVTSGIFDHRKLVPHYGIPDDLKGKRVLDVATFDGFWAFEFERRGADVTALDIGRISECDFPPALREAFLREGLDRDTGEGFHLAHEALGSKVKRVEGSVYDLDPDAIGTFDLVHVGDLLLHLENPIAALRAVRSVTAGQALISDCVDRSLGSGLTRYLGGWSTLVWWLPSLDTLAQMVVDAGFARVSVQALYALGRNNNVWRAAMLAAP